MSSVPVGKRQLSTREFYKRSVELRLEIGRIMHNEKIIPKRYRMTDAVHTIETARQVIDHLVRANEYYPNTEHNAEKRKDYLTEAIADIRVIMEDLHYYIELRNKEIDVNRLMRAVELSSECIALIKGARKNVKVIGG